MNGSCCECELRWDCKLEPAECDNLSEPVTMTRANKIRAMTDEELAEFLRFGPVPTHICFICGNTVSECNDNACRRAVLYWLRQPAEEGTV